MLKISQLINSNKSTIDINYSFKSRTEGIENQIK